MKLIGIFLFILSLSACTADRSDGVYSIHSIPTSGGRVAIVRFNENTGETWYRKRGKFKIVIDQTIMPSGSYSLELMSWSTGWGLLRINNETGETWVAKDLIWEEIIDE